WKQDKALNEQLENGVEVLTLDLTRKEIEKLARTSKDLIGGIEPYLEPQPQMASAMISSRINPYALNYGARQGDGVGIYTTEFACPNPGFMTNYTRLWAGVSSGILFDHSEWVHGVLRAASPSSYVYCRAGAQLPLFSDLDGVNGNPPIYISNISFGYYSLGKVYQVLDKRWDNFVYNHGVLVFGAAGNSETVKVNGVDVVYKHVYSPSKGFNIITVGNYDDANDTIAPDSNFIDPQSKNQKPELSAPGQKIVAGGHSASGTSAASPHAAAFAADLFSAYSWLRLKPAYSKAFMLAAAKKNINGGEDAVGVGGLDFYDGYYSATNTWWEGGNASFDYYDNHDSHPNSGYIEREVYLSSYMDDVQIAFSWLNRPEYTYWHQNDTHPIAMDMDIRVIDPNGNYVAGSSSWDNPYEVVRFNPAVSGTYTVKISRYANRDTSTKFHAGLSINW
ncbi:MAG TPA: hypothetical protein DD827_01145, partial [Gammaproteobacteria bacterium]|nr:hypothetical protein [Gammaproteobacteria bacterium]